MIFRSKNKIQNHFVRPRTQPIKLDLSITSGDLIWTPATTWENTDTDYFAASASPLQILSFRAPSGFSAPNGHHFTQLPNIAGRWVLKLNPTQVEKFQSGLTNRHFGWAETHATYTTFANAELVFGLADDPDLHEMRKTIESAVGALIAAHCVTMESAGSLRVLPAGSAALMAFQNSCFEEDAVHPTTVWDLGELARHPDKSASPKHAAFDITPPLWGQDERNAAAKKSLGWLKKRLQREHRNEKQRKPLSR